MPLSKPLRGINLNKTHPLARGFVDCCLINEGGGNKVYDLSGNQNTGTFYNHTMWTPGKFGLALTFDGTDDYVRTSLNGKTLKKLTIEFWAYLTGAQTTKGIFSWAQAVTSNAPFVLLQRYSSTQVRWHVNGGYRATINASDNSWHHFAVTYDGAIWSFYTDGVLSTTYTGGVTNQANAIYTYFGNGYNGYFSGLFDHIFIYNLNFPTAEIAWLYREPFAMFEPGIRPIVFGAAA
jgi:hypothetical protein